ncbi:uncharacterized protein KY384_000698 [Bacidia gigantensis]|uniref:uncharacterized protein n=1 Tax=Bacidia gigantensis TaxID=2732470 RepID=UPI001D059A21|nr:uncharacterized protein KY384_000698 [Bacidia gigantensis]KAG8525936.1 hypothetical protein KY384_000698 [Bacidia gigantensis]
MDIVTTDKPSIKRHSREVSHHKASLRRSTKGPLDIVDLLSIPSSSLPPQDTNFSPPSTPLPTSPPTNPVPPPTQIDITFLTSPKLYHTLPPPLFASSALRSPNPTSNPSTLFASKNYHAAALASASAITTPPSPLPHHLFELLHIRLASLTQLHHLPLAIEEARALEDVHSAFYRVPRPDDNGYDTCSLPWKLRMLVTRLLAYTPPDPGRAGDGVRIGAGGGGGGGGVAGFYELARDARVEFARARSEEEKGLWKERARECAWGVVEALEGEGDFKGAVGMLKGMVKREKNRGGGEVGRGGEGEGDRTRRRLVLLYVRVGDVDAARMVLEEIDRDVEGREVLEGLVKVCLGDWEGVGDRAAGQRQATGREDTNLKNNDAVRMFYAGKIEESVTLLESLVENGRVDRETIFNLATLFELMGERGVKERKEELVERVLEKLGGDESVLAKADFKL